MDKDTSEGQDLLPEEIDRVNRRANAVLSQRAAMPYHPVLYRLGEVGSRRVEQRLLRRALTELVDNHRPRFGRLRHAGPWEPLEGIYVDADAAPHEAQAAAIRARESLLEIARSMHVSIVDGLAEHFASTLDAYDAVESARSFERIELAAGVEIETCVRIVAMAPTTRRVPTRLMITHQPDWLYPDDKNLWRFLKVCSEERVRGVILARAIAPGTFPLLEAVDATGVQYYSTLVPEEDLAGLAPHREALGWSHLRAVESFADHKASAQLRTAIESVNRTHVVRPEVASVEEYALLTRPTISQALAWWRDSGLPCASRVNRVGSDGRSGKRIDVGGRCDVRLPQKRLGQRRSCTFAPGRR